jgi:putative spermidine/putrescine transport system ATP-binding protein
LDGFHQEPGTVTDVIYLGAVTRYVIQLAAGETLVALRQNLQTAEDGAQLIPGSQVQAAWLEAQTFTINPPSA